MRCLWSKFMLWFWLRKFRFLGWLHGLPSLREYTDQQVIDGLAAYSLIERTIKENKLKVLGIPGVIRLRNAQDDNCRPVIEIHVVNDGVRVPDTLGNVKVIKVVEE